MIGKSLESKIYAPGFDTSKLKQKDYEIGVSAFLYDKIGLSLPRNSFWAPPVWALDIKATTPKNIPSIPKNWTQERHAQLGKDFLNLMPLFFSDLRMELYNSPDRIAQNLPPNQVVIHPTSRRLVDRLVQHRKFEGRTLLESPSLSFLRPNFQYVENLTDIDNALTTHEDAKVPSTAFYGFVSNVEDYLNGNRTMEILTLLHKFSLNRLWWRHKNQYLFHHGKGFFIGYEVSEPSAMECGRESWPPKRNETPGDMKMKKNFNWDTWQEYLRNGGARKKTPVVSKTKKKKTAGSVVVTKKQKQTQKKAKKETTNKKKQQKKPQVDKKKHTTTRQQKKKK